MYMVGDARTPSFETIGRGYLYRVVNDHLVESYGEIQHRDEFVYNSNNYEPEASIFIFLTDTGQPICKEYCSEEEGVVVDGKVWLSKPDRFIAANFLMLYEVRKLQELREQMERAVEAHTKCIDILSKERGCRCMKDNTTVTFKPTCVCGYTFKRLKFGRIPRDITDVEDSSLILPKYDVYFDPACCPSCGRRIDSFIVPMANLDEWEYEEK